MNESVKFEVINSGSDQQYEVVWDFTKPGENYYSFILWMANDSPDELRIVCESQEMYNSFLGFYDKSNNPHWKRDESEIRPRLHQDGDLIWSASWGNDKQYVLLAPLTP